MPSVASRRSTCNWDGNAIRRGSKLEIMATEAIESLIDGVFGAAEECLTKDVPTEVAMYLRQTCALSNNSAVLKGASFTLDPKIKALSQSLPAKAHKLVLPGDINSTDTGVLKGAFGL